MTSEQDVWYELESPSHLRVLKTSWLSVWLLSPLVLQQEVPQTLLQVDQVDQVDQVPHGVLCRIAM